MKMQHINLHTMSHILFCAFPIKLGKRKISCCIVPGLVLHLTRTFSQQNRKERGRGGAHARAASAALFPRARRAGRVGTTIAPLRREKGFSGSELSRAFILSGLIYLSKETKSMSQNRPDNETTGSFGTGGGTTGRGSAGTTGAGG